MHRVNMTSVYLILFFATLFCQRSTASVLDWVWGRSSEESTVLVADGVPLVSIPYESKTEDEKFLQEAAKFTEIQVQSPLETCQHKVIMRIRTSCSDLSEEELAKLSVNLLNCQSAVEGRKMFPCTEEMSLKQCTTDMDADMWNAYHLMSNRARAVCYAARSTQFRALTELTVNKLMQTAHTQIKSLNSLKENQDRLEEQTVQALNSLTDGNKALLKQQQSLKDAQTFAHNLVTTNLRELTNERALIRAGNAQLAEMAETIKKKLEEANENIAQQAVERGQNHKEILEDLMSIQEQAKLIWDKIESSTDHILAQHEEALQQYEKTLEKLTEINSTINFIWNITNTMRVEVDQKLNWITNIIGDTGEQMHKMYRVALHIVYILIAMIVASFLQAPFLTRATIVGIVPLNLATYLKHGLEACLDFTSITALILLITGMHYLMTGVQKAFSTKKKVETETVPSVTKNGHVDHAAEDYTSSSYSNSASRVSFNSRLKKNIRNLYIFIYYQIDQCIQKCRTFTKSCISWGQQNVTQQEELSCSYIPSRKSREDIVYNYDSMISEDATDFETSNLMDPHDKHIDHTSDFLVHVKEMADYMGKARGPSSINSYSRATSRSVTPANVRSRTPCRALTTSGRRCRISATRGQNFCSRHSHGTSIIGD